MKTATKTQKGRLAFLLLLLAVFFLWCNAVYYGQYIEKYYGSVGIRLKGQNISRDVLLKMEKNEKKKDSVFLTSVTAWNRTEKMLECSELQTKTVIPVIEVYGDMNCVYPIELASGGTVLAEDARGCMIDEATAYQLYKTVNALGNILICEGNRYYVRGVLHTSEQVCLIEIYSEKKNYTNLELEFTGNINEGQYAADLLRQYGITEQAVIIDGKLCARILEGLYLLPAWLLGFYLVYDLLAVIWKRRTLPVQVLILTLFLVAFWLLLTWLMEFRFSLPEQLVPTKWSDFSFWSGKAETFHDWKKALHYLEPSEKDIIFQQYAVRSICYALAAVLGTLIVIMHERMLYCDSTGTVGFLLIAVLECIPVIYLYVTGRFFALPRAYLGMPIFYMMLRNIFRRYKSK